MTNKASWIDREILLCEENRINSIAEIRCGFLESEAYLAESYLKAVNKQIGILQALKAAREALESCVFFPYDTKCGHRYLFDANKVDAAKKQIDALGE